MHCKCRVLLVLFLLINTNINSAQAASFKLGKKALAKIGDTLCGIPKSSQKWIPVKAISKGLYSKDSSASKADIKSCKSLLARGFGKTALTKLPKASTIARSKSNGASMVSVNAVSGTPPQLSQISSLGATNVFWGSSIFDGFQAESPSEQQCSEFWVGPTDGSSAGLLGCTMVEDLGYAFEPLLRSQVGVCYMEGAPTQANLDAGAISLVAGELPENDITKLFVPGAEERTVKINLIGSDQVIFVKLPSSSSNNQAGYHFRADILQCESGSAMHNQSISLELNGQLKTISAGTDAYGTFNATVSGALTNEGNSLKYKTNKNRTASVNYLSISGNNKFRSAVTITPNDLVKHRFYSNYRDRDRKAYSVSKVSGDSLLELQFSEGAYEEQVTEVSTLVQNFQGAAEYRDTHYVSAPENELISQLESVDPQDEFYAPLTEVSFDSESYDCSAAADIELNFDASNPAVSELIDECDADTIQSSNFCLEPDGIRDVIDNYETLCAAE